MQLFYQEGFPFNFNDFSFRLPLYYEIKIIFLLWLLSPATKVMTDSCSVPHFLQRAWSQLINRAVTVSNFFA